jgi:hypothetical protein
MNANLAHARKGLREAVEAARLAYQFGNGSAYAYEAYVRCMEAEDAVTAAAEQRGEAA